MPQQHHFVHSNIPYLPQFYPPKISNLTKKEEGKDFSFFKLKQVSSMPRSLYRGIVMRLSYGSCYMAHSLHKIRSCSYCFPSPMQCILGIICTE